MLRQLYDFRCVFVRGVQRVVTPALAASLAVPFPRRGNRRPRRQRLNW